MQKDIIALVVSIIVLYGVFYVIELQAHTHISMAYHASLLGLELVFLAAFVIYNYFIFGARQASALVIIAVIGLLVLGRFTDFRQSARRESTFAIGNEICEKFDQYYADNNAYPAKVFAVCKSGLRPTSFIDSEFVYKPSDDLQSYSLHFDYATRMIYTRQHNSPNWQLHD